jgi:cell division protein DivIC
MKYKRALYKLFLNRYWLAAIAFVVWMLFFDEKNYYAQRERQSELEGLSQKISFYEAQLAATEAQLKNLDHNPKALEKYARERYFMKRDNEDVFVVDTGK